MHYTKIFFTPSFSRAHPLSVIQHRSIEDKQHIVWINLSAWPSPVQSLQTGPHK